MPPLNPPCGAARYGENDLELAHLHVQLFARDHQQSGVRASPLKDAARLDRRRVVGVDRDPRVDLELIERAVARVRTVGCLRLPGKCRAREREPDDQRAAALEEVLARELLLMQETRHGYLPPFAITAAACLIAVRMRG